jgi:hypothetical protein
VLGAGCWVLGGVKLDTFRTLQVQWGTCVLRSRLLVSSNVFENSTGRSPIFFCSAVFSPFWIPNAPFKHQTLYREGWWEVRRQEGLKHPGQPRSRFCAFKCIQKTAQDARQFVGWRLWGPFGFRIPLLRTKLDPFRTLKVQWGTLYPRPPGLAKEVCATARYS